jgi:hypothetical protein
MVMSSSESSSPDATSPRPCTDTALAVLVKGLPEMLLRQFEYEDPIVRGGKHLLHSAFFKELVRRRYFFAGYKYEDDVNKNEKMHNRQIAP